MVISEFKAINETGQSTTVQGKTVYSDWIELQNRGATAVNLGGWYLTDDPDNLTKWALPAVQIAPGGFLLVFASGIEEIDHPENWPYRDTLGYYHTNFTLGADGEYLALISPDLLVAHEYGSIADRTDYPTPAGRSLLRPLRQQRTVFQHADAGPQPMASDTPRSRTSRSSRMRQAPTRASSSTWS